jgi:hypothetical protein
MNAWMAHAAVWTAQAFAFMVAFGLAAVALVDDRPALAAAALALLAAAVAVRLLERRLPPLPTG